MRLLLSCVRQRLLRRDLLAKLERRLRQMADAEAAADRPAKELEAARNAVADVDRQLPLVARNMALAATEAQRQATAAVFDELTARRAKLAAEVAAGERANLPRQDAAAEVDAAMAVACRLTDLAADPEDLPAVAELFRRVNARLFVRFRAVLQGKRRLRKPLSGVVTFGDAPPPIELYAGTTTRQEIKEAAASGAAAVGDSSSPSLLLPKSPGSEGDSLGNVSRGDRIRTCGLLVPNHMFRMIGMPNAGGHHQMAFKPWRPLS